MIEYKEIISRVLNGNSIKKLPSTNLKPGINLFLKETQNTAIQEASYAHFQAYALEYANKPYAVQFMYIAILVLIEIDKEGLLSDRMAGQFAKYEDILVDYMASSSVGKLDVFLDFDFSPAALFFFRITNKKNSRSTSLFVKNITSREHDFIAKFFSSLAANEQWLIIDNQFELFLNLLAKTHRNKIADLQSYNDNSFLRLFNAIQGLSAELTEETIRNINSTLLKYYTWIEKMMSDELLKQNFQQYTLTSFRYLYFASAIREGYVFVNYSIYDNPPAADKLVLIQNESEIRKHAMSDKNIALDVSFVNNDILRHWLKECFWFDTQHEFYSRVKCYSPIFGFIKVLDSKLKQDSIPEIQPDDILAYRSSIVLPNVSDKTVSKNLGMVKYFLNYLSQKQYCEVPPLCFQLLTHSEGDGTPYKDTYSKEEIEQLLTLYKNAYEQTTDKIYRDLYHLYYLIIAILCVSEMRVSTILSLTVNSLVPTLISASHTEYKVRVFSKSSGNSQDEYNITKYVKNLIDEAIAITDKYRKDADGITKDFIFIHQKHNYGKKEIIRQDCLAQYHKKLCKDNGFKYLRLAAIRNYYMQQVSNYVTKNNDDPMLIERLSKHGINVHLQHYDEPDILQFCQEFYDVEIGSISLKGRVEQRNPESDEKTVAKGCGHCSLDNCILKGNLDCLMCSHFITTLDCIPFFEREIETIDNLILSNKLQHEKEFLINKKRLNVAYLEKLYELEENLHARKS